MSTACLQWGNPYGYSYPRDKKIVLANNEYSKLVINFTTTACEPSTRSFLFEEIENVYIECKETGWDNNKKNPSSGITKETVAQAKEFANFISEIDKIPTVVPYSDGNIGLEWNIENNIIISVVFIPQKQSFIYSIITNELNEYGENLQTTENQNEFVRKISRILKNA